jgi:hypothetical protein
MANNMTDMIAAFGSYSVLMCFAFYLFFKKTSTTATPKPKGYEYVPDEDADRQISMIMSRHHRGLTPANIASHLTGNQELYTPDGSEWTADKVDSIIKTYRVAPKSNDYGGSIGRNLFFRIVTVVFGLIAGAPALVAPSIMTGFAGTINGAPQWYLVYLYVTQGTSIAIAAISWIYLIFTGFSSEANDLWFKILFGAVISYVISFVVMLVVIAVLFS